MQSGELGTKIVIEARVFRAKEKPKMIPQFIWDSLLKKQFPLTGRWVNLGEIVNKTQIHE